MGEQEDGGLVERLREARDFLREFDPSQAVVVGHAANEIERLRSALDLCMVGGNHLANVLIGQLTASFPDTYPADMDHAVATSRWRVLGTIRTPTRSGAVGLPS